MNIQELRQSLKMKWLSYYEENRPWLVKMRVWATYNGIRRPSSGFMLATLSGLEPNFAEIMAFLVELNNNPDDIVAALGLNFNPDTELNSISSQSDLAVNPPEDDFPEEPPVTLIPLIIDDVPTPNTNGQNGKQQVVTPEIRESRTEIVPIDQPRDAIASNAKIPPQPTLTITPNTPKPLPSIGLKLATAPSRNGKILRSLEITTTVPSKPKTLISSTSTTEISHNGKYQHKKPPKPINKVNHIPHTNASNLASWVDEFCQGTGWEVGV
ncbi:DUF5331 domain-containing protein [Anabaena sp. CA = ATCC 33047]|uniref:DUF5331 domain-containing protein n=1 Tax=Anabaena sp. (strain CA / ATCC 33047) TaxID=52271 RepID=UPI00082B530B|nr:DUF5331 domain-containing protein [Anabaena sp. CA = ATCC 33047]